MQNKSEVMKYMQSIYIIMFIGINTPIKSYQHLIHAKIH